MADFTFGVLPVKDFTVSRYVIEGTFQPLLMCDFHKFLFYLLSLGLTDGTKCHCCNQLLTAITAEDASEAFDEPLSKAQVLAIVDPFIIG